MEVSRRLAQTTADLDLAAETERTDEAFAAPVRGSGPIPVVAAAHAAGAHRSASEQAFDDRPAYAPRTQVFPDGSTKTTGGPTGGTTSTPATTDRGDEHVEHGYRHDGNYVGMPQIYTGNPKADLDTARRNAEAWARERREKAINTIGPDGSEQSFPYSWLGRMGGEEVQYFGALHDVQSVEAKVQAMYSGKIAEYKKVTMITAVRGYELARRKGGAAAAELTRTLYQAAGFEVSGPDDLNVGPKPTKKD